MIWESQTNSATSWPFTNIDLIDQYCNNIIPIVGITHQGLLFIAGAYELLKAAKERLTILPSKSIICCLLTYFRVWTRSMMSRLLVKKKKKNAFHAPSMHHDCKQWLNRDQLYTHEKVLTSGSTNSWIIMQQSGPIYSCLIWNVTWKVN